MGQPPSVSSGAGQLARTPPLGALYSDATSKLRARGHDCLTRANKLGGVVGKGLAGREFLRANAARRSRRQVEQREHRASHCQPNNAIASPSPALERRGDEGGITDRCCLIAQ